MSVKNLEVEFKYLASVGLSQFKNFCEDKKPIKFRMISGYDTFYCNPNDPLSFYRHRVNENENQLTFKRQLSLEDNFIREEHNIDLPASVSEEKIRSLCHIPGYSPHKTIFKNCFIYMYDYYILVYYICYDTDLNELGRFIEIEMNEDHAWVSKEEAFSTLIAIERLCKPIGASPERRITKSLCDMFGRIDI